MRDIKNTGERIVDHDRYVRISNNKTIYVSSEVYFEIMKAKDELAQRTYYFKGVVG